MHTLVLSITFSVAVSIFLKLARRHAIQIEQAIVVNYATAAALCLWLLHPPLDSLLDQPAAAWWILGLLGVQLPGVFLIMAAAVRQAGIVRSDTAQRLSLILPILAAFFIFQETLSGTKAAGVGLALCALACLLARPRAATDTGTPTEGRGWRVLLGVWAGYGCIDILFKQMSRIGAGFTGSLLLSFVLAGLLLALWLLARGTRWQGRSLMSGLLLGCLNFGNIYCYIRAHQTFPDNPTLVFAAMNIGVISLGTLIGAGLFRERLSALNILGIVLALGAIVLLFPR